MSNLKLDILVVLAILMLISCKNHRSNMEVSALEDKPVKVELVKSNGKYKLLVNKKPFYIKGAGLEFGNIPAVKEHHGNSFRTWRIENGQKSGKEVLDEAYNNGLLVTMGIEVARERHGFDYNNKVAVSKQLESIKQDVLALKDHPALLMWSIGNELNLRYTNPKVWDAVNDISKMIHQLDPNHLTTTTLAGIPKKEVNLIKERSSDLDLLCFQVYGDLAKLPKLINQCEWENAYVVTEWGATGHWEVPKTNWGAPIEENSTIKAANYLQRYQYGIMSDTAQCIGSYVFLWGNKQERTPTWYGIFLDDGSKTEAVDVMHYLWSGYWPKDSTPKIQDYYLNNKTAYDNVILKENNVYEAQINVFESDAQELAYKWELLYEATKVSDGGDFEPKPDSVKLEIINKLGGTLSFKAPKKGEYRLFIYVFNKNHSAATANIPFKVI